MQAHIPDNVPATDGADTSAAEVPEPQAEATNRVHLEFSFGVWACFSIGGRTVSMTGFRDLPIMPFVPGEFDAHK